MDANKLPSCSFKEETFHLWFKLAENVYPSSV